MNRSIFGRKASKNRPNVPDSPLPISGEGLGVGAKLCEWQLFAFSCLSVVLPEWILELAVAETANFGYRIAEVANNV